MTLPSRHQLGDMVRIRGAFRGSKGLCPITGILFREGKVAYEVAGRMFDSNDVYPADALVPVRIEQFR